MQRNGGHELHNTVSKFPQKGPVRSMNRLWFAAIDRVGIRVTQPVLDKE